VRRTLLIMVAAAALAATGWAAHATTLGAANHHGYQIITPCSPTWAGTTATPPSTAFHLTNPAILVSQRRGTTWQLGALEGVFTQPPPAPPLPGGDLRVVRRRLPRPRRRLRVHPHPAAGRCAEPGDPGRGSAFGIRTW
jgi:hypothetical protein